MVKKFFPVFLILALVIIIFSYYQKNNPAVKRILDSKRQETTKSNIELTQPANLIQKSTNKSEKIFLQIYEPKNNITVANQVITVMGKTVPVGFVFVNDQEFKADSNGNFSTTVLLDEGENYLLVVVSDDLGNSIEKDILVNLETTQ